MEEQQQLRVDDIINSKVKLKSESEYRAYDAINYSSLSKFSEHPSKYFDEVTQTDSMIVGSIVDNLFSTGGYGEYLMMTAEKPSGQLGEYCDHYNHFSMEGHEDPHQAAYEATGVKQKKPETMVKDFMEKGGLAYVDMMRNAGNKKLVSPELWMKATSTYNRLKDSEITKVILSNSPDIEVLYQVPVVFDLPENQGEGKALIDLMIVNHKEEEIFLIDLKTTSDSSANFRSSFMKWKYYLQASYYYYGVKSRAKYTVKSFSFLTISTTKNEPAVLWSCNGHDIMVGAEGIYRPNSNSRVKGWKELVEEVRSCERMNDWSLPVEILTTEPNELGMFDKWR
jgi:hypothetical protein